MKSQLKNNRTGNLVATLAIALVLLASTAAEASRKVYFSTPAFRDCYISVYNPGDASLRLDWGVTGLDAPYKPWTLAFSKTTGLRGAPIGKNSGGNLPAGGTVLLAFTKMADLPGTFSGYLYIGENTGAAVASGVCLSTKGVTIPFQIAGGQPF